jgi:hypothetical protein
MENFLRLWNVSAASAETTTLQVHAWFLYCVFCSDSHTASTHSISLLLFIHRQPHCKSHVISLLLFMLEESHCRYKCGFLITTSVGKPKLQVPTLFSYYCLYRDSHTSSTLVVSVLPWWLRGIFNRYTLN